MVWLEIGAGLARAGLRRKEAGEKKRGRGKFRKKTGGERDEVLFAKAWRQKPTKRNLRNLKKLSNISSLSLAPASPAPPPRPSTHFNMPHTRNLLLPPRPPPLDLVVVAGEAGRLGVKGGQLLLFGRHSSGRRGVRDGTVGFGKVEGVWRRAQENK